MDEREIMDRIIYLEKLIKTKKKTAKTTEGRIRVDVRGNRFYYDYYEKSQGLNDKRHLRMSNKSDCRLAMAIAQRGYDVKVLRAAQAELNALKTLAKCHKAGLAEDVFEKMSAGRRELVKPIRLSDEQFADQWQSRKLTAKEPHPGARLFSTERGEKVNSKTEKMIADRLWRRGIHYHYEAPVRLTDHITGNTYTVHPDFTVLNMRTRKTWLWEHLGMADDPAYQSCNMEKLIDYQNAGIPVGEKLILTFETKNSPMMPEAIDEVIDRYFV